MWFYENLGKVVEIKSNNIRPEQNETKYEDAFFKVRCQS